VHEIFPG